VNTQRRFDEYYARKEPSFGPEPTKDLRLALKRVTNGHRALDLGAGDGRNTLLLTSLGYHVTAVDISRVGLDKLRRRARLDHGAANKINIIHSDVSGLAFAPERFDLVVAVTLFDHLKKEDVTAVMARVTHTIRPGGLIYSKVHTVDDPGFSGDGPASELSNMIQHYFERGELLRRLSANFEIMSYKEKRERDLSHGEPHEHAFATAWARKLRDNA
jgi:cyclopropane fatty-acyl-phospholipid synthase-like methyltransferase